MKFDTEWDSNAWTIDDSVPLRIYSSNEEYILEIPLNFKELESLHEAIQKAFYNMLKWKKKKSKYLIMTEDFKKELDEYKQWEKEIK